MDSYVTHQTINYDLFARHPLSRPIREGHVKDLAVSLSYKNLLSSEPVRVVRNTGIIDEKYEFLIIDGNHRFLAARQLNLNVPYIILKDFKDEYIRLLFSNQAKWSHKDILEYHCALEYEEYIKFSIFLKDFELDCKLALPLTRKPANRSHIAKTFKDGKFVFDNESMLRNKISKGLEFLKIGTNKGYFKKTHHYKTSFFDAFFKLMDLKRFDWEHLIKKHEKYGCVLARHINSSGYYGQLLTFHGKDLDKDMD